MPERTATRSQHYLALASAFRLPPAGADRGLKRAYTRLFLGPGKPIAPPYESLYFGNQLVGERALQVVQCYAEAGLQLNDSERELPDHISLELAFMAHLVLQEEQDAPQAELWRKRQRRFLEKHLAHWLPAFCDRVQESKTHPFYCESARLAKVFLEEELDRLRNARVGGSRPDPKQGASFPRDSGYKPLSGRRAKRYPNINLQVDGSLCTLCTLCSDQCREGALSVGCFTATLTLSFDPRECNGCRACLRVCPEGAITIERRTPLSTPSPFPQRILAEAQRVVCPGCHLPHIAEPWLNRLAGRLGGTSSVFESLKLCPFCKAASVNDLPVPVGASQESSGHAE